MRNICNLLIFGTSDFAEVIYRRIMSDYSRKRYNFKGFVLDDEYCHDSLCYGERLYRYSELGSFFERGTAILICIGYKKMNSNRKRIFERIKKDGWQIAEYLDKQSIIHNSELGEGNIVLDGVHIGAQCKIGNGNIFHVGSLLSHHSIVGNFNFFSSHTAIAGRVQVGNQCFFGLNCCTKERISITDETMIGAGCYMNHDVTKSRSVFIASSCISVNNKSKAMAEWLLENGI